MLPPPAAIYGIYMALRVSKVHFWATEGLTNNAKWWWSAVGLLTGTTLGMLLASTVNVAVPAGLSF